jgi:hypothetical protein
MYFVSNVKGNVCLLEAVEPDRPRIIPAVARVDEDRFCHHHFTASSSVSVVADIALHCQPYFRSKKLKLDIKIIQYRQPVSCFISANY